MNEKIVRVFKENYPATELTEDEMRILFSILLNKEDFFKIDVNQIDKESEFYSHFKPVLESVAIKILLNRLEANSTIKMTAGALIMLANYITYPGDAVMYAYYMHIMLPAYTLVDIEIFSKELFPMGLFSREQLSTIWDAQKGRPEGITSGMDNLLDYQENW